MYNKIIKLQKESVHVSFDETYIPLISIDRTDEEPLVMTPKKKVDSEKTVHEEDTESQEKNELERIIHF